jgi:hypothetical protein
MVISTTIYMSANVTIKCEIRAMLQSVVNVQINMASIVH